jgi:uncharacterized protein YegP (UPF0339 family)
VSESTPKFIVFKDLSDSSYRWRLRSSTRETLAASERGYEEKVACEQEVQRLKAENYPYAQILDLTVRRR